MSNNREWMPGRRLASTLAFALLALAPDVAQGGLTQNVTMQHGGITRYWDYYTPAGGMPSQPAPLVIVLHGGNGDDKQVEDAKSGLSEWMTLADTDQFLVIYPNGTDGATGLSGATGDFNWNDCRNDAGAAATLADDVGFVSALIDWASATYSIDSTRVYATGSSNGGMMVHRLALELSDRIAAIGAIIASRPVNSDCTLSQPANPIAVLMMNGTADTLMPWSGGTAGQGGIVEGAIATRDFYRNFLGTSGTPTHTAYADINTSDQSTVARDLYSNGAEGTAVSFYTVSGGGHSLPSVNHYIGLLAELLAGKQNRDVEGAAETWDFFKQHGLDGPIGSATSTPTATSTPIPATATNTPVPPTPTNTPLSTTVTFTSVAADDGWVAESSETSGVGGTTGNSNTTSSLRVGDTALDEQYKTIVSFDTSSIPDGATILSADLQLLRGTLLGTNPFGTHGACYVDVKTGSFNNAAALENTDFQAAATSTQVATMSNPTADGQWAVGSLNGAGRAGINKTGKTQLRLYFSLDDNDNMTRDYIGFYSGDAASAKRPRLIIQYQ